jgi:hypothetical protein
LIPVTFVTHVLLSICRTTLSHPAPESIGEAQMEV